MYIYLGMAKCRVPFLGHCALLTLTSDLVSRIYVSGTYLLHYLRYPKFGVWKHLEMAEDRVPFWVTMTFSFTSDPDKNHFFFLNMAMLHTLHAPSTPGVGPKGQIYFKGVMLHIKLKD